MTSTNTEAIETPAHAHMVLKTFNSSVNRPGNSWLGVLVWLCGWGLMNVLDGSLNIENLSLLLVLSSAMAAIWLSAAAAIFACFVAVMAFNWTFIPPRGSFAVDLQQHALLLLTVFSVGIVVALLMARQRRLAADAVRFATQADLLRSIHEAVRDAKEVAEFAAALQLALTNLSGGSVVVRLMAPEDQSTDAQRNAEVATAGILTSEVLSNLQQCQNDAAAFQPAVVNAAGQQDLYLPVRGRESCYGAVLLQTDEKADSAQGLVATAQALCDQIGATLERAATASKAKAAWEEAHSQRLRNTMLAAISHDYRTPLATILGAASSLHQQSDRLTREQQHRLCSTIIDEVGQLTLLTDNTLQLARLDAPGVRLKFDWESAEEIVGSVVKRLRQRSPDVKLSVRVEPGLPLLRCDATLLVQLMNNLLDNAIKHAGSSSPIEIQARRVKERVLLAVCDRGPGVPSAWKERIFDAFECGDSSSSSRGAGVGLALCRAIVLAHGGSLHVRDRPRGGSCFECYLPLVEQPHGPDAPEAAS